MSKEGEEREKQMGKSSTCSTQNDKTYDYTINHKQ